MLRLQRVLLVLLALVFVAGGALAQEEMTAEEWQAEMNRYTEMRNQEAANVKSLTEQIASMKAESATADANLNACLDALYGLVGSNQAEAAAYRSQIAMAEGKASELMRLSDADLMARSGEVDQLAATSKGLWGNKLSVIPEFHDRLTALDEKIKSLQTTLSGSGKVYTVGTWARDRDCLWNISKKKDIYNDAWMWPKIWQGNRDQIKDPDVIHPGQKLKIPAAGPMTGEEKAAAKSYYSKKAGN